MEESGIGVGINLQRNNQRHRQEGNHDDDNDDDLTSHFDEIVDLDYNSETNSLLRRRK